MPLVNDPGYVLVQAASGRGSPSRCCPGRRRAHRARRQRAAARRLALRGLSAAQGRPAAGGCSPRPRPSWRSSRPGVGASLKILAELDPERPAAVCRELTKLHEEIVRGTARSRGEVRAGGSARGDRARRGRRAGRDRLDPKAVEAVRALVDAGARSKTAAKVVSSSPARRRTSCTRALLTW